VGILKKDLIKSYSFDEGEIIRNILSLHVKQETFDIDPCFSRGAIYKRAGVPNPRFCSDITNSRGSVIADSRTLPLPDGCAHSLLFDPPFLATRGKSLSSDKGNITARRFGVYENEPSLYSFYHDSIKEFGRILKPKSYLVVKCQDKVSSGTQYWSHIGIGQMALRNGFYAKDLFILLAKNRLVADWQKKNQQHARKFHCYYWVFEKHNKIVRYL